MKEQNRRSHAGSFRRFEFATSAKAAILWRGGDTGIEEKKERRERDRKRKREREREEEGRKEATEKRLRGDRKYRRVCHGPRRYCRPPIVIVDGRRRTGTSNGCTWRRKKERKEGGRKRDSLSRGSTRIKRGGARTTKSSGGLHRFADAGGVNLGERATRLVAGENAICVLRRDSSYVLYTYIVSATFCDHLVDISGLVSRYDATLERSLTNTIAGRYVH